MPILVKFLCLVEVLLFILPWFHGMVLSTFFSFYQIEVVAELNYLSITRPVQNVYYLSTATVVILCSRMLFP